MLIDKFKRFSLIRYSETFKIARLQFFEESYRGMLTMFILSKPEFSRRKESKYLAVNIGVMEVG